MEQYDKSVSNWNKSPEQNREAHGTAISQQSKDQGQYSKAKVAHRRHRNVNAIAALLQGHTKKFRDIAVIKDEAECQSNQSHASCQTDPK